MISGVASKNIGPDMCRAEGVIHGGTLLGGPGACTPGKILKARTSEMAFPTI